MNETFSKNIEINAKDIILNSFGLKKNHKIPGDYDLSEEKSLSKIISLIL